MAKRNKINTNVEGLCIHNDLILAMDRGEVTSLILLDLSAAFDTVDHSILLARLQNWFGLDGLSLDRFSSYLSFRSQTVSINDSISAFSTLSCGVPQGSVQGYTSSLLLLLLPLIIIQGINCPHRSDSPMSDSISTVAKEVSKILY